MPRSESKSKGLAHPRAVPVTALSAASRCLADIQKVLVKDQYERFVDFLSCVEDGTVGGHDALLHVRRVLSKWPHILHRTLDLAAIPLAPPARLSSPDPSAVASDEEVRLLTNLSKVWYKKKRAVFYWLSYPRLFMEPERIKKGVKIYCEWDSDKKGIPRYYDATIVRRHKKNGVIITFDEDPRQEKYCLTYRGGTDTPTNRKRDMIFTTVRV